MLPNAKLVPQALWLALALIAAVVIGGCSALNPDNPAATLQAEREGYIAEATSIAQSAQAQAAQVQATAVAAQTHVAQMEGRNQQLLATLRVVLPPTQQIVNRSGAVTPGSMATQAPGGFAAATQPGASGDAPANTGGSLGDMQFTQVGTASNVRDSDGCAVSLEYSFPANIQRIYITTRALNVKAGTQMHVEWDYQGQSTHTEDWTVPNDDADFCSWFYIEPTGAQFAAGNWSVSLTANGVPVNPPTVNFTIGG